MQQTRKDKKNDVLISGWHAIDALIQKAPHRLLHLYIQESRYDDYLKNLKINTHLIETVSLVFLDQLTSGASHQGIAAAIALPPVGDLPDLKIIIEKCSRPPFLLILDGIQDPHNLGACLRSAAAAGVDAVIIPKDRAATLTSTVYKVSSGAVEQIPLIAVTNLARTLEYLREQNIWLYGAEKSAKIPYFKASLTGAVGLVVGNESTGLRRLTRDTCDALLSIPIHSSVDSLNVSVATGILLFEVVRQNLLN